MLVPCRLTAPTIATRCNRASTLSTNHRLPHQCAKDGRRRAVPTWICVHDRRCRDTASYPGSAAGNDRRGGVVCGRLASQPRQCRVIHSARIMAEPSGRRGAQSRASVESCNTRDHYYRGWPCRPRRGGAYRTGGRRRSITVTLRQDGRIGSSSGLKTSQRSSARRCTAKLDRRRIPTGFVGSCRTA